MLNKKEFCEYMQIFKEMQNKELDLYNNTDGVLDILEIEEYHALTEAYIEMLAKMVECNLEDLWYYIGECEMGNNVKTLTKNGISYVLDTFEQAYDWLTSGPEICDCFKTYFNQDGTISCTRCAGTKEIDLCDCSGDRNRCSFYWFDREGHSHIK